jgi:hypothetical protein
MEIRHGGQEKMFPSTQTLTGASIQKNRLSSARYENRKVRGQECTI